MRLEELDWASVVCTTTTWWPALPSYKVRFKEEKHLCEVSEVKYSSHVLTKGWSHRGPPRSEAGVDRSRGFQKDITAYNVSMRHLPTDDVVHYWAGPPPSTLAFCDGNSFLYNPHELPWQLHVIIKRLSSEIRSQKIPLAQLLLTSVVASTVFEQISITHFLRFMLISPLP